MGTKYLTFDCYGTLVDWKSGIQSSLVRAAGRSSLKGKELLDAYIEAEKEEEGTYRKYREVLRRSALRLSDSIGAKVTEEGAKEFSESVPRWPAFPDTAKFLKDMKKAGYRLYILSNIDNDLLRETIRTWKFDVDGFVTAEDVGSYKPNFAHWERFIDKTGAKKEDILHVAQSVFHDIVPTQKLNIGSAWVNRYREPMPEGPSPIFVSDTLAHLGELLKEELRKA